MAKTKVWYGNQYMNVNLDSKWSQIKALLKKSASIGAIICIIAWLMLGALKVGQHYFPNKVYAQVQVEVQKELKFEDIPILIKICNAESGGRQFKKNGDVLRGLVTPSDIGFCQINEVINNDEARRLGFDIYTEKGNKDYAMYLFFHRGTQPWNASKDVWSK